MRVALILLGLSCLGAASTAPPRDLSFEERVEAQRAIEKVYYAHQIDAALPFEQAVPRAVLEKKVRTSLKLSAALEELWHTPITRPMLEAELRRIVRGTQFPGRLEKLYAALGHDSFLIQETFARATLAGRLARSFFTADGRFRDGSGRPEPWDKWWARTRNQFDEARVEAVASDQAALMSASPQVSCVPADVWDNGTLDDVPDPRPNATAVWTGTVAIFWGGGDFEDINFYPPASYRTGGRYDPLTDT